MNTMANKKDNLTDRRSKQQTTNRSPYLSSSLGAFLKRTDGLAELLTDNLPQFKLTYVRPFLSSSLDSSVLDTRTNRQTEEQTADGGMDRLTE